MRDHAIVIQIGFILLCVDNAYLGNFAHFQVDASVVTVVEQVARG